MGLHPGLHQQQYRGQLLQAPPAHSAPRGGVRGESLSSSYAPPPSSTARALTSAHPSATAPATHSAPMASSSSTGQWTMPNSTAGDAGSHGTSWTAPGARERGFGAAPHREPEEEKEQQRQRGQEPSSGRVAAASHDTGLASRRRSVRGSGPAASSAPAGSALAATREHTPAADTQTHESKSQDGGQEHGDAAATASSLSLEAQRAPTAWSTFDAATPAAAVTTTAATPNAIVIHVHDDRVGRSKVCTSNILYRISEEKSRDWWRQGSSYSTSRCLPCRTSIAHATRLSLT